MVYCNELDWSYASDRKNSTSVISSSFWKSGEFLNIAVGVVPVTHFPLLCVFSKKRKVFHDTEFAILDKWDNDGLECLSHRVAKL